MQNSAVYFDTKEMDRPDECGWYHLKAGQRRRYDGTPIIRASERVRRKALPSFFLLRDSLKTEIFQHTGCDLKK